MAEIYHKIFSLSENSLTVEFDNKISPEINDLVLKLSGYLEEHKFEGFIESVPSFSALTVYFKLITVKKTYPGFKTASEAVQSFVSAALNTKFFSVGIDRSLIEIPVSFDLNNEFDLSFLANSKGLRINEFIEIFVGSIYRVYMNGFLPGFAYMGEVDKRIAAPRKDSPRLRVPKGSVGIAGLQTGIYPFESPGGWQIIGQTNLELFTPNAESPTLLKPGDHVKFYPVNL